MEAGGGGVKERGAFINFPPLKREGLFERGGLTLDCKVVGFSSQN